MAGNVPAARVGRLNPTIPIDQSIYEESTVKKAPLGTKLEIGDRVFRYAKAGAGQLGVKAGRVACSIAAPGTHGGTFVTPAVATTGALTLYATVAGGALTVDTYEDGFWVFGGGTRAGEVYSIKSNGLGDASTGLTNVAVTLYDPVVGTVTATSLGALLLNKYICSVATTSRVPVGVSMINVTEGNYFWLQTKGPAGVIAAATPAAFQPMAVGTTGVLIAAVEGTTGDALKVIVGVNGPEAGVAATATPTILMLE